MIKRVVKMEIMENKTTEFIFFLKQNKSKILSANGCESLTILHNKNIFFTYSSWKREEDLERYRKSHFFKETWSKAKTFFSKKPEAWSLNEII